jgi:hypothetical protein
VQALGHARQQASMLVQRSIGTLGRAAKSEALLIFRGFPAKHWRHPTNRIESTFATVRHRTVRSRRCLSNKVALAMTASSHRSSRKVGIVHVVTAGCRKAHSV